MIERGVVAISRDSVFFARRKNRFQLTGDRSGEIFPTSACEPPRLTCQLRAAIVKRCRFLQFPQPGVFGELTFNVIYPRNREAIERVE